LRMGRKEGKVKKKGPKESGLRTWDETIRKDFFRVHRIEIKKGRSEAVLKGKGGSILRREISTYASGGWKYGSNRGGEKTPVAGEERRNRERRITSRTGDAHGRKKFKK